MVDLKAKPFNLDDEGVAWVTQTLAGMSDAEKIGQLFVNMGSSRDEAYLTEMVQRYHIAAVRYQPGPAADIFAAPQNEYTRALLAAVPPARPRASASG